MVGKEYVVVMDSREKKPLWFPDERHIVKCLKTGDYSIFGFEDFFSLEFKRLIDLFGTLGKGHLRFKRELERAQRLNFFAIVIEGSRTDILRKAFNHSERSMMKGKTILSILDTLAVKYKIQIYYCNGPREVRECMSGLMNAFYKQQSKDLNI